MIIASAAVILGLGGLIVGAHYFVDGAAAVAKRAGVSLLVIGLTVVALGTSAPEIMVSISAALVGSGSLAVGNALGSNLANIGLVLGFTALVSPLPIALVQLRRELPLLIIVTLGVGFCLFDGTLDRFNGVLLMAAFIVVFYYLLTGKAHQPNAKRVAHIESIHDLSRAGAMVQLFTGLFALTVGAQLLVWGAKIIAVYWGVSELVVGLTVVAVGTSLPEFATTVASALKKHHDMAIGNILGSNLFNLLAVMAVPALISPMTLDPLALSRDYMMMTAITLLLAALLYGHYLWARRLSSRTSGQRDHKLLIGRFAGLVLLSVYASYYWLIFLQDSGG